MPEDYINLGEAISMVRRQHQWIAASTLRQAVRDGLVPFKRGSANPKARYYVRLADLQTYVDGLPSKDKI